jgi:hypothetical protein
MNPDKKYMSQSNLLGDDIKFVPPAFMNRSVNDKENLDLFSSETGLPELCYYSNEASDIVNGNSNFNTVNNTIPTTFDTLRNIDFDINETEDLKRANSKSDVSKIYSRIERRHPGIFATLYSYRIPRPIVRVIIKRLIGLTLAYCDKGDNY